jgi:hypothetical protein
MRSVCAITLLMLAVIVVAVRGWHPPAASAVVQGLHLRVATSERHATSSECVIDGLCGGVGVGIRWHSAEEHVFQAAPSGQPSREPADTLAGRFFGNHMPVVPAGDLVSTALDP